MRVGLMADSHDRLPAMAELVKQIVGFAGASCNRVTASRQSKIKGSRSGPSVVAQRTSCLPHATSASSSCSPDCAR